MGGNKRGSFVQEQLAQLHASELTPGQAKRTVVAFLDHYRSLYERDVQRGKQRKMDFLSSAQSALSRLKRAVLQKYGARAEEFSRGLKLGASETRALRDARERRVYAKSIDLVDIDGDEVVLRCRELLWSEDPYTVGIALAALTGRRAAELVHSLRVAPPLLDHFTHAKYWGRITGVLKQRRGGGERKGERGPLKCRSSRRARTLSGHWSSCRRASRPRRRRPSTASMARASSARWVCSSRKSATCTSSASSTPSCASATSTSASAPSPARSGLPGTQEPREFRHHVPVHQSPLSREARLQTVSGQDCK